jgi:hypothetical protein
VSDNQTKMLNNATSLYMLSLVARIVLIIIAILPSALPWQHAYREPDYSLDIGFYFGIPLFVYGGIILLTSLTYLFNDYVRRRTNYALKKNIFGTTALFAMFAPIVGILIGSFAVLTILFTAFLVIVISATLVQMSQVSKGDLLRVEPLANASRVLAVIIVMIVAYFSFAIFSLGIPLLATNGVGGYQGAKREAALNALRSADEIDHDRGPVLDPIVIRRATNIRPVDKNTRCGQEITDPNDYRYYAVTVDDLTYFGIIERSYELGGCFAFP